MQEINQDVTIKCILDTGELETLACIDEKGNELSRETGKQQKLMSWVVSEKCEPAVTSTSSTSFSSTSTTTQTTTQLTTTGSMTWTSTTRITSTTTVTTLTTVSATHSQITETSVCVYLQENSFQVMTGFEKGSLRQ